MKTILITGSSSGFGLEIARYFLQQGWKVIATMRTPNTDILPANANLKVLALDVTDAGSIQQLIADAGPIDVLVNNAGVGLIGAVESTPLATVRDIFETNTIGTIAMTQAVLPQMRERRSGTIINVTSAVTMTPFTLLAVYSASKAAVETFSRSLAKEVEAFNVQVRIVQPGRSPETRFGENAMPRMQGTISEPYAALGEQVFNSVRGGGPVTTSQDVAEGVWRAATDSQAPMHIPAGEDSVALAASLAK
ncbi:short-chain dehydrogenase/reductase [Izhakiella australiensis]|uniref:Short-chain dehydrogenase/reductase n=1 Tax=Izhakiella australiensis TaxID=1926881 RepID=A0A1S8YQF4_9GAMM|nr:SDR family oxidoreductase [Izhakiella australiensis]OON41391.1 short-chain dehydrogenase/reductase [Izhakiella australiensis]